MLVPWCGQARKRIHRSNRSKGEGERYQRSMKKENINEGGREPVV